MSQESQEQTTEVRKCAGWSALGTFALIGLAAAATLIVVSKTRRNGKLWNVDDLIAAADRAAEKLERSLLGEQARAS